jgi:DNA-binding XRE family transcriptional regulator
MLNRNYNGYSEFYHSLESLIRRLEIFEDYHSEITREYVLGDNPYSNRELTRTSNANGLATIHDIFKYRFRKTNPIDVVKFVYACFVYSYLRYSKNELYFRQLEYGEITLLTNDFDVFNLISQHDMANEIHLSQVTFQTINQLNNRAQIELFDLLHEIANLFTRPIGGFEANEMFYLIQNPQSYQDLQTYLHDTTKKYFNYNQTNSIKTFKSLKNYIRALHLSDLIDITCIDNNVFEVIGAAFFGDPRYFNLKSTSKENLIFNYVKLTEILFDMGKHLHKPISVLCNMITIIAAVDKNRLMSMF